jgi:hypothetical protein
VDRAWGAATPREEHDPQLDPARAAVVPGGRRQEPGTVNSTPSKNDSRSSSM